MRNTLGFVVMVAALSVTWVPTATAQTTCSYAGSAYSDAGGPAAAGAPVNDPLYPRQWGLEQIKAPAAWARGAQGAGATIAVVDTGVDLVHPDLSSKLLGGADFVPGGGACAGAQDEEGHGTHVAGIAAAATDNGTGVAGTAPGAAIMPVRTLDDDGSGEDAWIIAAIRHAADNGADVINLSLGGLPVVGTLEEFNQELEEAVAYAWSKGSVIVGAAGNETFPLCSYPAAARYALCVGATDSRGLPSYYSNFPNDPDETIGVRAPGGFGSIFCEDDEDVWSTIWPGSSSDCQDSGGLAGYDTLAGTSMAAPYASGVAALLSGQGLTNAQIMECLKTTSSNQGAYDPVYGYGIVDADAATAQCSPTTTPSYDPTAAAPAQSGGDSGGSTDSGTSGGASSATPPPTTSGQAAPLPFLRVTMGRASRRTVARRGWVRVRVTSDSPIAGTLQALVSRRARGGMRVGSKRFRLDRVGTETVLVKLTRRGRRAVLRRGVSLRVRYIAGELRGFAGQAG